MIDVRRTGEGDPLEFEVVVREGKGETRHHVTMAREACKRLTAGKHTPERCLEAAFRLLLEREPKESILGRFDVTVIAHYFPEFERELPRSLAGVTWGTKPASSPLECPVSRFPSGRADCRLLPLARWKHVG